MAIYKRGETYWYEFQFDGKRIRESAQTGNKNVAKQIEAAHRTRLAKGEAGIDEKPTVPTFKEFAPRFEQAMETQCQGKPRTIAFYKERMRRLLDFPALTAARLDEIDEQLIESLKHKRTHTVSRLGRKLSVSSINRELATLRRLLRLAQEWRVIDRVPRIRLFGGEESREFVLSYDLEKLYLGGAPDPLANVAMLMLDTGVRPGEACALEWRHVHLDPADGARFGRIHIAGGKSKNAKRNLSLTARVTEMLERRKKTARGAVYVFPGEDGGPGLVSSLDHQHSDVRDVLKLPAAFVVHSLRHTFLTRLGESGAGAFEIMKIAGHSSVTVSQRYVHPTPESQERAFEKLDAMNSSRRGESAGVPTKVPTVGKQRAAKKSAKSIVTNAMGA